MKLQDVSMKVSFPEIYILVPLASKNYINYVAGCIHQGILSRSIYTS